MQRKQKMIKGLKENCYDTRSDKAKTSRPQQMESRLWLSRSTNAPTGENDRENITKGGNLFLVASLRVKKDRRVYGGCDCAI
jgi:hypothetical protein